MLHPGNERWFSIRRRILGAVENLLGLDTVVLRYEGKVDHKWHQDLILHLASVMRPENYLEVGIFHCGLFNRMLPYAKKLTGVDLSPGAGQYMVSSPKAKFVCSDSVGYAKKLKEQGETFDFIFIDADHSEKAVQDDFLHYEDLLRPHGLILLHDTHPIDEAATSQERCGDGYLAIDRFSRQTDKWEMMTIPLHPGLTLCRRRTRQLDWLEE